MRSTDPIMLQELMAGFPVRQMIPNGDIMELEWTKTADGSYTALGMEEESEQDVTFVIKNDKMLPSRPWTVRVSSAEIAGGLVGRQPTLREAKNLAHLYCTMGLGIQAE